MDRLMAQIDGYLGWIKSGTSRIGTSFHSSIAKDDKGLMDAVNIVLALVMIVVVGAIGIYIADKTLVATGLPADGNYSNITGRDANLTTMQLNLINSGKTGASFIIILVISFIGGIAISYMFGMLGRTRRG